MISWGALCPVGIVAVTIRFSVSMTEIVLLPVLETYAFSPSGVIASRIGDLPTGIFVVIWLVAESITVTEFESVVTTKSCGSLAVVLAPADG